MAGYLTTHVLDTALGLPAEGMVVMLFRIDGSTREGLVQVVTNEDGRTDTPILPKEDFKTGVYELVFHAGHYLRATMQGDESTRFLDEVPIRFTMSEEMHYHVPLLLSPYSYSTYRGS
ncbi:hydroxyisourate hydrolase [Oceanicola sp. 502str15]|uniref:hydroxyisourate hydrolase n=1 Tax=Oceanicola sp. 502str15 TaxID=2696061 RepID=UPI0020952266|nr:hydroxyisourate hydrolase [Oceanicola sp. 502str15]MCO6383157.1 hydroxyisourate hydrolase [Oceanicola sp. 502str15]